MELVQLGFISEVNGVLTRTRTLKKEKKKKSRNLAVSPFQGDQPRLASVLEEAFSKFYSRNGSLNPVTVSS